MMTRSLLSFSLFLGLLAATGCGGGDTSNGPVPVPVSGVVTLDGNPVEKAIVTFVPMDSGKGASGMTDASGRFVMSTASPGDGAVPGKYQVKIVKPAPEDPSKKVIDDIDDPNYDGGYVPTDAEIAADEDDSGDPSLPPPTVIDTILPEAYAEAGSSGLSADITEAVEDLSFQLVSK